PQPSATLTPLFPYTTLFRSPLLLYNNAESKNDWLGLKLVGTMANPAAIGAAIKWSVGGKVHTRLKNAGGSFMSSYDPREVLGLRSEEHTSELQSLRHLVCRL